jgi:hypothetical protein
MHDVVMPIGRINAFVGFTGSFESIGNPSLATNSDDNTPISNGDNHDDDLSDDANSILPILDY